jgi:hypothetical protein
MKKILNDYVKAFVWRVLQGCLRVRSSGLRWKKVSTAHVMRKTNGTASSVVHELTKCKKKQPCGNIFMNIQQMLLVLFLCCFKCWKR